MKRSPSRRIVPYENVSDVNGSNFFRASVAQPASESSLRGKPRPVHSPARSRSGGPIAEDRSLEVGDQRVESNTCMPPPCLQSHGPLPGAQTVRRRTRACRRRRALSRSSCSWRAWSRLRLLLLSTIIRCRNFRAARSVHRRCSICRCRLENHPATATATATTTTRVVVVVVVVVRV